MRTSPVTASSGDANEFLSFIEIDPCFDLLQEKKLRQLEAFRNFVNSKTDSEEPEATAEFFRIMDAEEARKAAV